MGIENAKQGKLIYHLTKLENLDSILENGLLSRKTDKNNNMSFSDVADKTIIKKRKGLGLNKYVPFHFHPYSSFDVAVKNAFLEDELIYICVSRKTAIKNDFKILPMHPLSKDQSYELFDYDEGFDKIEWEILQHAGLTDKRSRNIKMAECLSNDVVPFEDFRCIYVRNHKVKKKVEEKIEEHGLEYNPPFIYVQKCFFLE
ncbi:DUF4433 domain-containing protein [Clostridium butyricum]|nr:DarT ssDNA thymidine ADP-ribosyltransferase family protein [Clostridium butyricum]MDI9208579.1 DUF4433 domain-containing protein [Clostridium butyricum]